MLLYVLPNTIFMCLWFTGSYNNFDVFYISFLSLDDEADDGGDEEEEDEWDD